MSESANMSEVDRAVAAARAGLEWWRPGVRCRIHVRHFLENLRTEKPALLEIISEETGKPRWEAATEVDAMIGKVELSLRALEERRHPTSSTTAGVTAATRYKPHGVVAVLGPFNFPGHLPNGHIIPALLAGNTVLFKPSEHTPRTARRMHDLWRSASVTPQVFNVVEGGPEVGEALVKHPGVDGVFFTGSFRAGRAINRMLADTPGKIAALEMGGNNPLVVYNVSDLQAAAYATIQSAFLSAGQRCSCARRLIVVDEDEGSDRFIDAVVAMMKRIRVGRYTDQPEPFMGRVINAAAARRLLAAQAELAELGGRPIVEMKLLDGDALLSPGLIDVTDAPRRDEEIFGPLLQLIRVGDFDAAIAEANNTRFGLAAGLLSDSNDEWQGFYNLVRAGVVNWNRPLTGGSSALPFGGIGDSGNHRPSAYFAADYCSYPVASLEIERVEMPDKLTPGIDL